MYKGKGVKVGDTAVLSQDVIIGQGSSVGADVVLSSGLVTKSISIDSLVLHVGAGALPIFRATGTNAFSTNAQSRFASVVLDSVLILTLTP